MSHLKVKINFFSCFLILLIIGNTFGQNSVVSTEDQIKENIALAPCKSKDRLNEVKKLFQSMGADEEKFSTEKFKEGENLIVKLKGKSDETVVIGAHYDKVDEGCGAIDNWTGIVIIANIYKTLSQLSPQKSYVFAAFDQEEKGLLGSKAMVKGIPKENFAQYCSMINVDSFGFASPQAADNMSSPKMIKAARNLAKEIQFSFADAPINNADADSSSFVAKKIPAITFHGLSNDWAKYLHSSNDKIENVNVKSVYLGYRFTLAFIGKVDEAACAEFK